MKKILFAFVLGIFALSLASAFSATRTVSGNDVTVSINTAGTTGFILDEVIPIGVTVSNIGQSGVYTDSTRTIRWLKLDNGITSFTYSYTGSGIVSGIITAGITMIQARWYCVLETLRVLMFL